MPSNNFTNTLVVGTQVVYLPECHSTNDEAGACARDGAIEGTIVVTANQTAGRGQRGASWESEIGANLTMTVVLRPTFLLAREQVKISIAVSVAVANAVRELLPAHPCDIKWPNDILIGRKKVGGILIENTLRGEAIHYTLVGIGINVNQLAFAVDSAGSLAGIGGEKIEVNDVMRCLLKHLDAQYLLLRVGGGSQQWLQYYKMLLGYQVPMRYRILDDDSLVLGVIKGVDQAGRLQLWVGDELQIFDLKSIQMLI
jgi:BirA family transcriptional regulator, biotin operon repressor / biotin---[acetyl-CoA-carboxylase] ligase